MILVILILMTIPFGVFSEEKAGSKRRMFNTAVSLSEIKDGHALVIAQPIIHEKFVKNGNLTNDIMVYVDVDGEGNLLLGYTLHTCLYEGRYADEIINNPIIVHKIIPKQKDLPHALLLPCKKGDYVLAEIREEREGHFAPVGQWFISMEYDIDMVSKTELEGMDYVERSRKIKNYQDALKDYAGYMESGKPLTLVLVLDMMRRIDRSVDEEARQSLYRQICLALEQECTPKYVAEYISTNIKILIRENE